MKRKSLIAGTALALALTAALAVPVWLGAAEQQADETTFDERPSRGFLGVGLRQLTPELQTHFGAPEGSGVLVASLTADGPAAAAGIRVGDVITAVDGLAVDSSRDLAREVRHRPGETVEIELYRDGARRQVTVALGQRQARHRDHQRSPEELAEMAERWERWGEEFGEKMEQWGEEFGERWGEEFGERWEEEFGQEWAEEMARRGERWEEMGEEIGRAVEQALRDVDWEAIGRSVEESMKSLEELDWESMGAEIERHMEELEKRLEERRPDETGAAD